MIEQLNTSLEIIIQQTQANLYTLGMILLIIWGVFFLSLLDRRILLLGIIPRTLRGLPGIIFAPCSRTLFTQ